MDANKLDVDVLFKQYTVREIQAIELQIRNEMEKKKEDLRIMVYNRYRDIIEAADGIHVMKTCSKQIENVIGDLQISCEDIFSDKENQESANLEKARAAEKAKRNNKYVLAVIIKILQTSPSKIWYHLDNQEYMKAAKQYLLAQNAHTCLELEKSLKSQENASYYIKYANELWSSIVFLSNTIINKSREAFSNVFKANSSKLLIDAILGIYLLENTTLAQIYQNFISDRTPIILSILNVDSTDQNLNINERTVNCLKAFVNTVYELYHLFSSQNDDKSEDFESLLNDASFTTEALKDDGFVIHKIPIYLKNAKFKSSANLKRFEPETLVSMATKWLDQCLGQLKEGVLAVLKYATNLRSLVFIRDAVLQYENGIVANTAEKLNWESVCRVLFNRKINLWADVISPFYYAQSKTIIETSFRISLGYLTKNLQESISDKTFQPQGARISPETDINAYQWSIDNSQFICGGGSSGGSESATSEASGPGASINDTGKNSIDFFASSSSGKRASAGSGKNVPKQYGATPAIQRLCKCLDEDLSKLIGDIEFSTTLNATSSIVDSNYVLVLNEDFRSFHEFLQANLNEFASALCEALRSSVEGLRELFDAGRKDETTIGKILLVSRLAYALPNFCPSLKSCFGSNNTQLLLQQRQQLANKLLNTGAVDGAAQASPSVKKAALSEQKTLSTDPEWLKLMSELRSICKSCFSIWIEHICEEIKSVYLKKLALDSDHILAVDELIAWDEIEIEDELGAAPSESVKPKLNAPLVCSPLVQGVLYHVCQELTRNLPYTMIDGNLILKEFITSVVGLILDAYRKAGQSTAAESTHKLKLTQNQALQMLFDLKYLFALFDLKTLLVVSSSSSSSSSAAAASAESDRQRQAVEKCLADFRDVSQLLEGLIDPFDYEICLPFMQSNINKCIGRSSVLYGVLSPGDRFSKPASAANFASTATTKDKHNLVVLSSNFQRFELLPISNQSLQQQPIVQLQTSQSVPGKTKPADEKKSAVKTLPGSANPDSSSNSLFGFRWFQ